MLFGIVTFAVGLALCVAIFVALDVKMLFLVGPVMGLAIVAYLVYRSARRLHPSGSACATRDQQSTKG
jgi:uncharacterized membrane protein